MRIAPLILVGFATGRMLPGTIFCPDMVGKTLEMIEKERCGEV